MGRQIPANSKTVSAASAAGVLTVVSTADLFPDQIGWLSKSGVVSQRVQVSEIVDATTFRCRILAKITDDNFAKAAPIAYPGSNFGDLSGFNGGSATFASDPQIVAERLG